MQWKLPSTISSFVQRAGRAARGAGRTGLAVLLVERSAYDVDLEEAISQASKSTKKKTVRTATEYPKSKNKEHAAHHGVLRGAHGGKSDAVPAHVDTPLDSMAIDEGLHSLVQNLVCRRSVLTQVYNNKKAG